MLGAFLAMGKNRGTLPVQKKGYPTWPDLSYSDIVHIKLVPTTEFD